MLGAVATVGLGEDRYVAEPPSEAPSSADPAGAAVALAALADALVDGDDAAAAALAPPSDPAAADLLADLAANADRLRVRDVSLRYVDQLGVVGQDGAWTARADLTWALSGFDTGLARTEVQVGLVGGSAEGDGVAVTGFTGGRVPLWLRGPVLVDRADRTLVVTSGRDPSSYAALADRALPQVRAVLPASEGGLVVEVPSDAAELDAVLGVPGGTYAGVAAVTASVDGRVDDSSPVHVFVNPEQLDRLRPTGAQVVMTHEAVHAFTDAPTSRAPIWLVEGIADYVALRDVDLPLSRTAAQVIERVRRDGVPADLPDQGDFDLGGPHLGAAYEAAWLACQALADLAGEDALIEVYRRTSQGTGVEVALQESAGLDVQTLTLAWQDLLVEVAGRS